MFHAIDRQTLVQVVTLGKSPVAESWLNVTDPILAEVQDSIPRYPYDPNRAMQLLAQAGWMRATSFFSNDAPFSSAWLQLSA